MIFGVILFACIALVHGSPVALVDYEFESTTTEFHFEESVCDETAIESALWELQQGLERIYETLANIKTGWRTIGPYQILFSELEMNYDDAEQYCKIKGGKMAAQSIRDNSTVQAIFDFAKQRGNSYWVGCNDREEEGSFVWNDGVPMPTESELWSPFEPNNNGPQNCVQIWSKYYKLDDVQCASTIRPICEKDFVRA